MAEQAKSAAALIEMEQVRDTMLCTAADDYEDKLSALQEELDRTRQDHSQRTEVNTAVSEANAQWLTRLSRMEKEVTDANKEKEELRERMLAQNGEIDALRSELDKVHRNPKHLEKTLSGLVQEFGAEILEGEDLVEKIRSELTDASSKALLVPDLKRTMLAERMAFQKKKKEFEEILTTVVDARKKDQESMTHCTKEWQIRVQQLESERELLLSELGRS